MSVLWSAAGELATIRMGTESQADQAMPSVRRMIQERSDFPLHYGARKEACCVDLEMGT